MDRESILQSQLAKGERAKKAHDNYLKDLIEEQKVYILNDFMTAGNDPNSLLLLKMKLDAILTIERAIKSDIDSSDMARKELGLI